MPMASTEPIELSPSLHENIAAMKQALHIPENGDTKMREFEVAGLSACLFYVDGMASHGQIDAYVLYPSRTFEGKIDCEPDQRAEFMTRRILNAIDVEYHNIIKRIATGVLDGKTAVLIDGCSDAMLLETRSFEKRQVGKTVSESVVEGAQQGFVESIRTNITLVRRIIRSPHLNTEFINVGTELHTSLALVYLEGGCNENVLKELRRRICGLDVSALPDIGHLQQLIEDRNFMLVPQSLLTERPDRTAYLLEEGRVAVLMENSPYALVAPMSLMDFMSTADDQFLRWQYASFNKLVRFFGLMVSLILPGLYVALVMFHTQLIPQELLTSITEARARVPFPVIVELLIMEAAFYLINEAGTRMPSQIGSALGIVGALILGQAAVAASIISPILIIIAAITGLGNYAIPDYGLTIAVQILRLGLLVAGSLLGLYGLAILLFLYGSVLCAGHSFGMPYMAPYAPWRPDGKTAMIKLPMWRFNRFPYFMPRSSWRKVTPDGEKMRDWEGKK